MRKWLKNLRREAKIKQSEIAEKLNISQGYYAMIENGERKKDLDISIAMKLSELFGVSVDWIVEQEKQYKST